MHNAAAAIEPAFYDHQDETVKRDRAAADWGADEVFATVPRRRFRGDQHVGAAQQARRSAARDVVEGPVTDADAVRRAAWLAEVEAELAAEERAAAPAPPPAPPAAPVEATVPAAGLTEGLEFIAPADRGEAPVEPAGRRTVTITGRPGALVQPRPLLAERRRPPRTVDERIGGRPDRAAGWAFGMGVLLIVVAAVS